MSNQYLDKNGLSYFLEKLKGYFAKKSTTLSGYGITDAKINSGTITLGSNTITPLTSHQTLPTLSRTISGSGNAITDITVSGHAITATKGATFLTSHQTLPTLSKTDSGSGNAVTGISVSNHAITVTKGSTFALDSDVVHKTGDETIAGVKTFSSNIVTSATLAMKRPDKTGILVLTGGNDAQAASGAKLSLNGSSISDEGIVDGGFCLQAGDSSGYKQLNGYPDGNLFWEGRNVTITDNIVPRIRLQNKAVDIVEAPNAIKYTGSISFSDGRSSSTEDSNRRTGTLRSGITETDYSFIQLVAHNPAPNSDEENGIIIGYPRGGTAYARAPSTSLDRNEGTDIVTRNWIPKDTRIVHTTGDETIAGVKTFTSNLVMSNSKSITFDLSASTPTVSTVRDFPIVFKSQSTAGDYTFTKNPFFEIPTTASNNYGLGVGFGASALTIIGAGESARDIVAAEELTGAMEKLVLTSDTGIDFFVNCNTIANRIPLSINSSGSTFLYSICSTYTDRTRGDTVTSWNHKTLYFGDKYARDNKAFSDAHTYGWVRSSVDAAASYLSLVAFRNTVADSSWGITITAPTDTDSPCYARLTSSPAVSDDSTKIATTEWVRDATGNTALNAATSTKIQTSPSGNTFVKAATAGGALVNSTSTGYGAIWNAATKDYRVACATHPSNTNEVYLCYSVTNENISSGTNTRAKSLLWNAGTGVLTADTFSGSLSGNASTATKLATARSLKTKLDSTTAVTFDGSAAQDAIPVTGILPVANGGTGHAAELTETTATDFNDYITTGEYQVRFTTDTLNRPYAYTDTKDCILTVSNIGAATNVSSYKRTLQTAVVLNAGTNTHPTMFIRKRYNNNGGEWSDWYQVSYITDDSLVSQVVGTANVERPLLSRYNVDDASNVANKTVYDTNVTVNPNKHTITASGGFNGHVFSARSTVIDRSDITTDSNSEYWPIAINDINNASLGTIGFARYYKSGFEYFISRLRNTNNKWADLRFVLKDDGTYYLGFGGQSGTVCDGFHGNLVGIIKDTIALDTISTIPSSDTYSTIFETRTNDDKILADMYVGKNTAGSSFITLRSRCTNGTSTNHAYLALYCNSDGTNKWATCPTPNTTTENSDKIATTAWVRTATGNFACNAANVTGIVAIANGGTGSSTKNFVDLSTTQTVAGSKTFTSHLIVKNENITRGTAPSSAAERNLYFYDSAGNKTAAFGTAYYTDKASRNAIYAYDTTSATGNNIGYISIGCDKNGNVVTHAPTPATASNDTNIATTAFVKAQGYVTANDKVKQVSGTGNSDRPILVRYNAADASETANYAVYNDNVTINTNTGVLTNFTGHTINRTDITKGTNPSATKYWTLTFCDKDGGNYTNNCIGMLETSLSSAGVVKTYMRAMKNTAATATPCEIAVIYDTANSTGYTQAPTPATSDNSTKIATTAFVKAQGYLTSHQSLANYVTLNGTQTITGEKTFPRIFWTTGAYHMHSTVVKGTNPSSMQYWSFGMTDKNGYADANTLGRFRTTLAADGTVSTYISAFKNVADSTSGVSMGVKYGASDSEGYTFAPTPATGDNSTKIATTAYVKAQGYVTTDKKVQQTVGTTNTERPLLSRWDAAEASGTANYTVYDSNITINPNKHTLTASGGFIGNVTGNCSGTSANVTGTVAIANGGTGATDRLNAFKNLTNQNVGSSPTHFVTFTSSWATAGYSSLANVKTALGLGSAAYTDSTDYVKLTGDQTIGGSKTFSSRITLNGPMNGRGIDWVANTLTKGTAPSSDQSMYFYFIDKNGYSSSQNNVFGAVGISQYASGTVAARLVGYSNSTSTNTYGVVTAGVDSDGVAYAAATSTSSTRTGGTDIVTRDWIPKDTRIVHITGAETISGTKTFSAVQKFSSDGICKSSATAYLELAGGSAVNKGSRIVLYGESHTSNAGFFDIRASASATKSLIGKPDGTLTWAGQTVSTSSDERIKTPLTNVPESVLNAWEDVRWGEFKFLEDVSKKGDSARLHTGLIAQAIDRVFKSKDLDACKYGILCHEEREATEDEPAVDLWMVRYTEALAMEAAYQRRKNRILEDRISELENQLASVMELLKFSGIKGD